ncbi:hypothetical protein GCM10012278_04040 [Nonomuraea glycinis]|uniref:Uncharacterized protein n=1 Tax=Nonomuraea glycinis TaxID=2047744 RepID=A0A918A0R1_9ACTN|nr:hypothetical protein GCM10012278_04040 [Nonomuraea glycinis]
MRTVHIEAKPDHLLRLARQKDPVGAVAEMIWNALDAEATHVSVDLAPKREQVGWGGNSLDKVLWRGRKGPPIQPTLTHPPEPGRGPPVGNDHLDHVAEDDEGPA